MTSIKPNFFIVGAPKCGTTALYEYLRTHPDIFMPERAKEPHHFAPEMAAPKMRGYRDRAAYQALFADSGTANCVGEASVYYLFWPAAARAIYDFNPAAKIIIMLRAPLEMLYSYYYQQLQSAIETLPTFAEALAAETDRKQGQRIPPRVPLEKLYYRDLARYSQQVQRYIDVFGRDALHIIIYDDLRADPAAVYRHTLDFLGVAPDFQPEFEAMNTNRVVRIAPVNHFIRNPPDWYLAALPIIRRLIPIGVRRQANQSIASMTLSTESRPPLDPALREQLNREFLPDIEVLSKMLGRDLTHWCQ